MTMILTLDLRTDLENRLQHAAGARGLDVESYVLALLQESLGPMSVSPTDLSEKELLAEINQGLSAIQWGRYQGLIEKREMECLEERELAELVAISEGLELANARRINCLAELASRRRMSVDDLMNELGIVPKVHG